MAREPIVVLTSFDLSEHISPRNTSLFSSNLSCCSFVISSSHPSLMPSGTVHVLMVLVCSNQAAFRALSLCPKLRLLSLAPLMFIV